jgi:hypothetical protein
LSRKPKSFPAWPLISTLGLVTFLSTRPVVAEDLSAFALCIADSGAVFYGAHWCPYCSEQKAMFGASSHLLPYLECFEPDTRKKRDRCQHVRRYPTWAFGDGTRRNGVLSLEKLAALTDCPAP